ncbi:MAG: ROK family protein [Chloroflexales bacterium]|nr:ROK family protein [Chloroflexales bacterium]
MNITALGIDIGGTKTAAALVAPDGRVSHYQSVATPAVAGAEAIMAAAVTLGQRVLQAAHAQGVEVAALGVGTAGHVDRQRGAISYASGTLPGWSGVAVAQELQDALGLPVSVDNDVNALAIGEGRFGAGHDFRDVLYITVGTGVGGALVFDGQMRRGATWTAGELGHLVIDWDGKRRCSCGHLGHLEGYTSGPAIVAYYCALAAVHEPCDLQLVAARARNGDAYAQRAIAESAQVLGLTLGGLLNVIDPQALIVGGGVTELGDPWWQPFVAALRANPMPGPARIAVLPAQLGQHAVLIGAAWLALCEHAAMGH